MYEALTFLFSELNICICLRENQAISRQTILGKQTIQTIQTMNKLLFNLDHSVSMSMTVDCIVSTKQIIELRVKPLFVPT